VTLTVVVGPGGALDDEAEEADEDAGADDGMTGLLDPLELDADEELVRPPGLDVDTPSGSWWLDPEEQAEATSASKTSPPARTAVRERCISSARCP
jgi:hypothetical protein